MDQYKIWYVNLVETLKNVDILRKKNCEKKIFRYLKNIRYTKKIKTKKKFRQKIISQKKFKTKNFF